MVIGAFPVAKLSVLLIKQISKPIANVCKERAKSHPFFRTYVCMPPAQFYNWCEVKVKMWILNLGKPVNIPVLSQDMAIELGANLLGEGVIFAIGATLLIFEYNRQANKEAAKEEKRAQEMGHITDTIRDLYFTVQQQQTQLKEMERIVLNLNSGKPVKITPPENPPKDSGSMPSLPQFLTPPQDPQGSDGIQKANNMIREEDPTCVVTLTTPYPDRGIILQSLNYVQMDVLSNPFGSTNVRQESKQASNNTYRRPGVISEALDNMENEMRSLF